MIDKIKSHQCKGLKLRHSKENGIVRLHCVYCGELVYEATEYEAGLQRLEAKEMEALKEQKEVEEKLKMIKAEVDNVFEEIVKFKESYGIMQNVR